MHISTADLSQSKEGKHEADKSIVAILVLALILPTFAAAAKAADAVGFQVAEFPSEVKTGEQVEVVISLTGYTAEAATADAIRGLQVDITGIDTSVLRVVQYTSLIEDTTAIFNTGSYNETNKRVRLTYVQMNGTLPAPGHGETADRFPTDYPNRRMHDQLFR